MLQFIVANCFSAWRVLDAGQLHLFRNTLFLHLFATAVSGTAPLPLRRACVLMTIRAALVLCGWPGINAAAMVEQPGISLRMQGVINGVLTAAILAMRYRALRRRGRA